MSIPELNLDRSRNNSSVRPQSTNCRPSASSREHSRTRYEKERSLSSKIPPASSVNVQDATTSSNNTEKNTDAPQSEDPPPYVKDPNSQIQENIGAPGPSPTANANLFSNAGQVNFGNNAIISNIATTIVNHFHSHNIIKDFLILLAGFCLIVGVFIANPGLSDVLFQRLIPDISGGDIMHGLEPLKQFVSFGAINGSYQHDPERRVHEGTRERVMSEIKAWIDNPNVTDRILWLHGPVGVGKSAIAQTIMNSYTTEKIPANFVFFHSDPDRNDGNQLFTTLAWQFASSIPAIKNHIVHSLNKHPDLPKKKVETQSQGLIVRPFEALNNDTPQRQLSDMVVVIDGLDECNDTKLQKRILEIIEKVATNPLVPLRFLIVSRPEAHINKTITRFQNRTFSIDLVEYADADLDIEKYLKDKFDEIVKDQSDIDPAKWPGQQIIRQLVYKASGQFIYASTVIKFVADEGYGALEIILGLGPSTTTQPFAQLDSLYKGILQRSDQEFLKTFLPLFVARQSILIPRPFSHTTVCAYSHLDEGYQSLMDVPEEKINRKVRKMRSLFNDDIGPHHRSFLEFLQDQSRSGQFHISTDNAAKQCLLSVIDSVVRSANESFRVIEQQIGQTNYHPPVPELVEIFRKYPTAFDNMLSKEDWREALRSLHDVQDRLLKLPNFTVPRNECTIFHIVHRLLLSISYRQLLSDKREESNSRPRYFSRRKEMFCLMLRLLNADPEVIALRVRSWSEAQDLMDLICHIVNGKYLLTNLFSANTARKATQLALEIHTKVPVLPQFSASTTYAAGQYSNRSCRSCDLEALPRVWLISNVLDHRYISPVLRIDVSSVLGTPPITLVSDNIGSIQHWRETKSPSSNEVISVMLKLARAIQYLHSIGIVLSDTIDLPDDIYVDSQSRVRISPMELVWSTHGRSLQDVRQRYETNIDSFGHFFCMMYFDTESPCTTAARTSLYKPESSVSRGVWQLIERCLSAEGKPSINEVVQKMESWNVRS